MTGMLTRTFRCTECGIAITLTVHAESLRDPRAMDRFRLLAGADGWCIDFDDRPWCSEHRPLHGKQRVQGA